MELKLQEPIGIKDSKVKKFMLVINYMTKI